LRPPPARRRPEEVADQRSPRGRSPTAVVPRCPGTGTDSACRRRPPPPGPAHGPPRRRSADGGGGGPAWSIFLVSQLVDTSKVWAEGGRSTSEFLGGALCTISSGWFCLLCSPWRPWRHWRYQRALTRSGRGRRIPGSRVGDMLVTARWSCKV